MEFREPKTIGIIGVGKVGKYLARLYEIAGYSLNIFDTDRERAENLARDRGYTFWDSSKGVIENSDVTTFCTPIEVTVPEIRKVAKYARKGSLLTDVTSVKRKPVSAMLKYSNPGVDVIGMHPMYLPSITDFESQMPLEGRTIILTPARGEEWLPWLNGTLQKYGARIKITTPEIHDRIIPYIQAVTHFCRVVFAHTLKDANVDLEEALNFASPIYEIEFWLSGRILKQRAEFYGRMAIETPEARIALKKFMKAAERLAEDIGRKDLEGYKTFFGEGSKYFGPELLGKSMQVTNHLINHLRNRNE